MSLESHSRSAQATAVCKPAALAGRPIRSETIVFRELPPPQYIVYQLAPHLHNCFRLAGISQQCTSAATMCAVPVPLCMVPCPCLCTCTSLPEALVRVPVALCDLLPHVVRGSQVHRACRAAAVAERSFELPPGAPAVDFNVEEANCYCFIGNIGQLPDIKTVPNGSKVANLNVAISQGREQRPLWCVPGRGAHACRGARSSLLPTLPCAHPVTTRILL
jgi:hypothetical protein